MIKEAGERERKKGRKIKTERKRDWETETARNGKIKRAEEM